LDKCKNKLEIYTKTLQAEYLRNAKKLTEGTSVSTEFLNANATSFNETETLNAAVAAAAGSSTATAAATYPRTQQAGAASSQSASTSPPRTTTTRLSSGGAAPSDRVSFTTGAATRRSQQQTESEPHPGLAVGGAAGHPALSVPGAEQRRQARTRPAIFGEQGTVLHVLQTRASAEGDYLENLSKRPHARIGALSSQDWPFIIENSRRTSEQRPHGVTTNTDPTIETIEAAIFSNLKVTGPEPSSPSSFKLTRNDKPVIIVSRVPPTGDTINRVNFVSAEEIPDHLSTLHMVIQACNLARSRNVSTVNINNCGHPPEAVETAILMHDLIERMGFTPKPDAETEKAVKAHLGNDTPEARRQALLENPSLGQKWDEYINELNKSQSQPPSPTRN